MLALLPASAFAADAAVTIDNFTSAEDPKMMTSSPLDTEDSFAFTFARASAYHYFCPLHPHVVGSVNVQ